MSAGIFASRDLHRSLGCLLSTQERTNISARRRSSKSFGDIMDLIRRIRGVLGTAVVWGVGWVVLTLPWNVWNVIATPGHRLWLFLNFVRVLGGWGALAGTGFALLLLVLERRNTLLRLRPRRLALWGILGATALPVALVLLTPLGRAFGIGAPGDMALMLGLTGLFGAGSAVGMLRVARGPVASLPREGAQAVGLTGGSAASSVLPPIA